MAAPTSTDQEHILNDVSRQLASSRLSCRLSRGSSVQSSQPAKHVSRVEKPRSTHNSPRVVDRRRTTTIASKRYTTLEDHWNMMFGGSSNDEPTTPLEERRTVNRPVSWHPSSRRVVPADQSPLDPHERTYSAWVDRQFRHTQDIDMASDVEQFPTFDSIHTQFQHLGYNSSNATPAVDSYATSPSWETSMQPATWSVPDWVQMTQSTAHSAAQTPSNFLPIQQSSMLQPEPDLASEASVSADDSIDSDKVLVGMGLYDAPEGYDSWFASDRPAGKGLKLEETWEPPETVDDDEDDEDDDEEEEESNSDNAESSSMEAEPTRPVEPQAPRPQITLSVPTSAPHMPTKPNVHQEWTMRQEQHFPANMAGRSFLFDEEETYTNEWWFHQLKQPTAQDAGLGYGWL